MEGSIVNDSSSGTAQGTKYNYSSKSLSLGLLYMEFKDAVKEGDGGGGVF